MAGCSYYHRQYYYHLESIMTYRVIAISKMTDLLFKDSIQNCTNITLEEVKHAILVRGISGTVCFVLGAATLISEIVLLCRTKTNFLLRLFFYLTISITLFVATFSLDLVHYSSYGTSDHDNQFCEALAFFAVYTASVILLFICAIVTILLHIVFKCASRIDAALHRNKRHACLAEIGFVLLTYILPLFLCWIPFVQGKYGNNAWSYCWFTDVINQCNQVLFSWEEVILFFVPNSILSLSGLVCVVILVTWFFWLYCWSGLLRDKTKTIIKEMFLLLGFLLAYCITWFIFLASSLANSKVYRYFDFWLVKSLVNPIIVAFIPSSFFFYMCAKFYSRHRAKRMECKRAADMVQNSCGPGTAPLSTRISAPSHTTMPPNMFSWVDSDTDSLIVHS